MEQALTSPKRVLGICGSAKKRHSSSEFLLNEALQAAAETGAHTRLVRLVDYHILSCRGCGLCMDNRPCPLLRHPADELAQLFEECSAADAFVFATPVYAFTLPALWTNWIQRCGPCTAEDLAYKYYSYDTAREVKGKALKGKTAGLIAVAASIGHEAIWSPLVLLFTCYRMNVVASASMCLYEYDSQPHIRHARWSNPISEAEFAIQMARAVGQRVVESIELISHIRTGGATPAQRPAAALVSTPESAPAVV